jgi:hypothetical protein
MENKAFIGRFIIWVGDLNTLTLRENAYYLSHKYGYKRNEVILLDYDYSDWHQKIPVKYRLPDGNPDNYFIDKLIADGYKVRIEKSYS